MAGRRKKQVTGKQSTHLPEKQVAQPVAVKPKKVEVDGYLSPIAIRVLFDFQKHFDLDRAFADNGVGREEREKFEANVKFRKQLMECRQWAEYGVEWTKEGVIARHRELYEELKEAVRNGDTKAAGPLANLIKLEMEAHGLMYKEEVSKTPVVNIQFNMGGATNQSSGAPDVKVVNGGNDGE